MPWHSECYFSALHMPPCSCVADLFNLGYQHGCPQVGTGTCPPWISNFRPVKRPVSCGTFPDFTINPGVLQYPDIVSKALAFSDTTLSQNEGAWDLEVRTE